MIKRIFAAIAFAALWIIVALALSSGLVLVYGLVFPTDNNYVFDQSVIDLTKTLIWPLTLLLVLFVLAVGTTFFSDFSALLRRLSGFKAIGYEITFSSEGAKKLSDDLSAEILGYAKNAKREFDRQSGLKQVRQKLANCISALSKAAEAEVRTNGFASGKVRATLHIQDIVFQDALYQLTDYYPGGGGAGRRFSVRFGAIGLAWRSGRSEIWNGSRTDEDVSELVKKWGMHEHEAQSAQSHEIAICVPLKHEGLTEAVLYIDSDKAECILDKPKDEDANKKLEKLIEHFFFGEGGKNPNDTVSKLVQSIAEVNTSLRESNARIKIYDNS